VHERVSVRPVSEVPELRLFEKVALKIKQCRLKQQTIQFI